MSPSKQVKQEKEETYEPEISQDALHPASVTCFRVCTRRTLLDSSKIMLADAGMYNHQNIPIRNENLLHALSLLTQSLMHH